MPVVAPTYYNVHQSFCQRKSHVNLCICRMTSYFWCNGSDLRECQWEIQTVAQAKVGWRKQVVSSPCKLEIPCYMDRKVCWMHQHDFAILLWTLRWNVRTRWFVSICLVDILNNKIGSIFAKWFTHCNKMNYCMHKCLVIIIASISF